MDGVARIAERDIWTRKNRKIASVIVDRGSIGQKKGGEMGMNDNDLITRHEVELVLLKKGQRSRRYSLGEVWELDFDEIREALSEYKSKIVRCKDCKYCVKEPNGDLYCDVLAIGYEPLGSKRVTKDWFCADGKRR